MTRSIEERIGDLVKRVRDEKRVSFYQLIADVSFPLKIITADPILTIRQK